jgi:sigma-B regulation protein RsbU (phosphoserine phosphatase)
MNDSQFHPDWERAAYSPSGRVRTPLEAASIPVVIAEDDPVSRKLITTIIEMEGYRTIVTADGDEAMSALRAQNKPCIAVVDWMMPGTDGAEICRRMRESQRSVYTIIVTARASEKDTAEGIGHGANDYLAKPFYPEELLARIRVGLRVLTVQATPANRVQAPETTAAEIGDSTLS